MMARVSGPQSLRSTPALRFLALCLGGWAALRIMMSWNPALPTPPSAFRAPPPFASHQLPPQPVEIASRGPGKALPRPARPPLSSPASLLTDARAADAVGAPGYLGTDRHALRFALAARFLPSMLGGRAQAGAMRQAGAVFGLPVAPAVGAPPARGQPFWIQRQMAGWSLGGWLYLREGSATAPGGIAAASQLGGSQAGMRLAYGFGETGRLRAYGRATGAVRHPQQRELAFGVAFAPFAGWPVDIAVEKRFAVGREGRTALAAMVTGGVSGVALPGDFRLDAYGQAGVVGTRARDGFADGAVVIDRRLGDDEGARLRLGALAAGAVQPGAARVDVGPRLTLRLPRVGEGSRIALDWRQRVAGDADPESGVALTLASDF